MSEFKQIQSVEAFEELLSLNKNELKVFESVLKSMMAKIRFDKEFVNSFKINVFFYSKFFFLNKIKFKTEVLCFQSWNNILDSLAEFNEKILENSKKLQNETIIKLNAIIKEKRESRQKLGEEKSKYEAALKKLKDNAEKARVKYNNQIIKIIQTKQEYSKASEN